MSKDFLTIVSGGVSDLKEPIGSRGHPGMVGEFVLRKHDINTCYKLQECPLLFLIVASQYLKEADNRRTIQCEAMRRLAGVAEHLEVPGGEGLHSAAEDLVQLIRVEHAKTSQGENRVESLPVDSLMVMIREHWQILASLPDSLHLRGDTFY